MKIIDIIEARKNPELNPKVSVNQAIISRLAATKDMAVPGIKGLFPGVKNLSVSFTKIDKLGINPRSEYKTPLGIYSYPAEYVVQQTGSDMEMTELPFAGDSPWANLFSVKGNILLISSMNEFEANKYYAQIADLWSKVSGKNGNQASNDVMGIVDDVTHFRKLPPTLGAIFDISDDEHHKEMISRTGGKFWSVVMQCASSLFESVWHQSTAVVWNKLFRSIGIDGVIDEGVGIIHPYEPTQAVFFSLQAITNIERVANKYSPNAMSASVAGGRGVQNYAAEMRSMFQRMTIPEIIEYLGTSDSKDAWYIKDKQTRMAILKDAPYIALFFSNPTAEEIAYMMSRTTDYARMSALDSVRDHTSDNYIVRLVKQHPSLASDVLYAFLHTPNIVNGAIEANPELIYNLDNPTSMQAYTAIKSAKQKNLSVAKMIYDDMKRRGLVR